MRSLGSRPLSSLTFLCSFFLSNPPHNLHPSTTHFLVSSIIFSLCSNDRLSCKAAHFNDVSSYHIRSACN